MASLWSWALRVQTRTRDLCFNCAGLGWLVFGHEPFTSKLEPVTSAVKKMMRGGRVPTVPTENNERVIPVDPKWLKTLCHFQVLFPQPSTSFCHLPFHFSRISYIFRTFWLSSGRLVLYLQIGVENIGIMVKNRAWTTRRIWERNHLLK